MRRHSTVLRHLLANGPRRYVLASAATASLSLAYQVVVSRSLGPAHYGSFATLASLVTVATVPLAASQTAAVQAAAASPTAPIEDMVARGLRVGGALLAAGILLGLPLDLLLGIDDPAACVLAGAYAGLALAGAITRGILLGRQRWSIVAFPMIAGACVRVVLATMVTPTFGLVGAMAATVVAEGVATAVSVGGCIRLLADRREPQLRPRRGDIGHALGTHLGIWVLATLAVVLGRRTVAPADAGQLAAAATATAFALFAPAALASAVLPRFASGEGGRVLRRALNLGALLGVLIVVGFALVGPELVAAAAGSEFRPERWMVIGFAWTIAMLGITAIAAQFLMTRRHPASLSPWLAGVAMTLVTIIARPGAPAFVLLLAASATAVALFVVHVSGRTDHSSRPSTAPTLSAASIDLSIVLPSHNDGERIKLVAQATLAVLAQTGLDAEAIVVLDGSTDGSERLLLGLSPDLRVIELPENRGKGNALRRGYEASRGSLVGYIDGDGDIDPEIIQRMVDAIAGGTGDDSVWCAAATKYAPTARVAATKTRRMLSLLYRQVVRQLFRLEVRDTQCGAKLFRRAALDVLLPRTRNSRFALDLELLALGCRVDMGTIAEVPVHLRRDRAAHSHIDAVVVVSTAIDTLRVWVRIAGTPMMVTPAPGRQAARTPPTTVLSRARLELAGIRV